MSKLSLLNFHEGLNRYLQEYTGYICMNLQEITGVSRKLQEITGVFPLQLKITGDYRNTGGLGGMLYMVKRLDLSNRSTTIRCAICDFY